MNAYTVVGPTNFQPSFLRSFESATDSADVETALRRDGPSRLLRIRLVAPDERRERTLALDELASALRVVDHRLDLAAVANDAGVANNRFTSRAPKRATCSISKSRNAARKFSRLARMVRQLRPD